MAEYIERKAVIELLEEKQRAICPAGRCGRGYVYGRDRDEYDAIEADIDTVKEIPAADVAPVVHARWIGSESHEKWWCSSCGKTIEREKECLPDFCEDCGAKMEVQDG